MHPYERTKVTLGQDKARKKIPYQARNTACSRGKGGHALENNGQQVGRKGVTMADSVETLGVDLRTGVKRLGERKSEEGEVQGEILAYQ